MKSLGKLVVILLALPFSSNAQISGISSAERTTISINADYVYPVSSVKLETFGNSQILTLFRNDTNSCSHIFYANLYQMSNFYNYNIYDIKEFDNWLYICGEDMETHHGFVSRLPLYLVNTYTTMWQFPISTTKCIYRLATYKTVKHETKVAAIGIDSVDTYYLIDIIFSASPKFDYIRTNIILNDIICTKNYVAAIGDMDSNWFCVFSYKKELNIASIRQNLYNYAIGYSPYSHVNFGGYSMPYIDTPFDSTSSDRIFTATDLYGIPGTYSFYPSIFNIDIATTAVNNSYIISSDHYIKTKVKDIKYDKRNDLIYLLAGSYSLSHQNEYYGIDAIYEFRPSLSAAINIIKPNNSIYTNNTMNSLGLYYTNIRLLYGRRYIRKWRS